VHVAGANKTQSMASLGFVSGSVDVQTSILCGDSLGGLG
jgi:hypothetical protein